MVYVIYKTTNIATGRFYIGKWSAKDIRGQSYLGSGKALRADIRLLGRAAFKRETLFVFDNPEDAIAMERQIVTKEFCKRHDTYNLVAGGCGSFVYVHSIDTWVGSPQHRQQQLAMTATTKSRRSKTLKQRWATDPEARERHQKGIERSKAERGHWGPSHQKPAARRRISAAMKEKSAAGQHPCRGTKWMTKSGEVKKVPARDVERFVREGWLFGRR